MTTVERLLAAARGLRCDRVPVSPWGFGRLDPEGPVAQKLFRECDPFLEVGLGVNVLSGRHLQEERRQLGDFLQVTIHTPRGPLRRTIKQTHATRHTVEFPCKCPADLEKFLSIPWELGELDLRQYRAQQARWDQEAFVLAACPTAVCGIAELLHPQDFCLLWADAPDLMRAAVAEAARRTQAYVEAACRAGVKGFRLVGGEYVSVQLGPRAFWELVVPYDRAIVQIMHQYGAVAYYHNHGPIMRYLEAIAEIGVDFLDPVEMPPFGDADLARARDLVANRFCLVGTFDDMEVLEKWPLERILAAVRERLRLYGTRGICIGGSASGTYGEAAARAFLAIARFLREGLTSQ